MRNTELTKSMDKTIGERIAAFRRAKKLSREQLAKQIGVSNQQLQKYEKGTNRVGATRMCLISKALNETMDCICGNEEKLINIDPAILALNAELSSIFLSMTSVKQRVALVALARTLG